MLEANLDNLNVVYKYLQADRGSTGVYGYKKCIGLATKDTALNLEIIRAYHAFGMSKMTVKDENKYAVFAYNVLKPVEFYEYIGRLAHEKFRNLDDTLAEKIEKTLDLIFPRFGLTRQRVKETENEHEKEQEKSS